MPAITPDLLERARGSLVGIAVGDAFGMALDGGPCRHVNAQVRSLCSGRLPTGHFTESAGAALALGESLLAAEPEDPEALARRLKAWQKPGRAGADANAGGFLIRLLGSQRSTAGAATTPEVADTTPLTRCLPLALAHVGDRNACLDAARSAIRLTHAHPDCVAGGAFITVTLWCLVRGMAPRHSVRQALEACGDLSEAMEETIRLASTRKRDAMRNEDQVQPMLESVVRALLTTASFAEAVARVTNLGGHAATAGALAGALAGAAYRHGGVPADWRHQVHGTWPPHSGRLWQERDLVDLADRLLLASGVDGPNPSPRKSVTISV